MSESDMTLGELPLVFFRHRTTSRELLFTTAEAARFLTKPGQDTLALHNKLKGAAQRGLIHPRLRESDAMTAAALFAIDDLAAGVVLFTMFDLGIADREVAGYASRALYAWDMKSNPKPAAGAPAPIGCALNGTAKGEFWVFKLTIYRDDQTDRRQIVAVCYDMDIEPPDASQYLPPSMMPHAAVTVSLPLLLLPLVRKFRDKIDPSRRLDA